MKRLMVVVVLIFLALFFSCSFIVHQGQYALKFNPAVAEPEVLTPGLHFKWPLINKIIYGSQQPQLLVADGSTKRPVLLTQTFDRHPLELGYSAIWRVSDPILFYDANVESNVLTKLRAQLNKEINADMSLLTLNQLLAASQQQIINNQVVEKVNSLFHRHGIKVTALFFTSINIATLERPVWIEQMKKQQENQLIELQNQTAVLAQSLRTATDNKITQTITQGIEQADQIRADADLDANKIYANAYNKDPAFYEFFHNLQMYKKIFANKKSILVLSTHTPFLQSLAAEPSKLSKAKRS
jgi:membrane protease subunit HflC